MNNIVKSIDSIEMVCADSEVELEKKVNKILIDTTESMGPDYCATDVRVEVTGSPVDGYLFTATITFHDYAKVEEEKDNEIVTTVKS